MEQKVKYAINLISENGQVVVSSREVAKNFGKEHKHVLRDIENLMEGEPKIGLSSMVNRQADNANKETEGE